MIDLAGSSSSTYSAWQSRLFNRLAKHAAAQILDRHLHGFDRVLPADVGMHTTRRPNAPEILDPAMKSGRSGRFLTARTGKHLGQAPWQ
jgi:hypothetical protein